ncbi:MAG TPA: hypothetical protein VFR70_01780, partial [Flavobacterium sp.]|nr:hypothetical protein [Flavobacterium sp.]
MIKSYKYVLIIHIIILLFFWLADVGINHDGADLKLRTFMILAIGLSPFLLLMLSILLQKVFAIAINSDSLKGSDQIEAKEEKIWKTAFFAYLIFCGVSFLASLGIIFAKPAIHINYYYETMDSIVLLSTWITIGSFIISIFIKIKNAVWEINNAAGILMVVLAMIVFGISLFMPSIKILDFYSSEYDGVPSAADSTAVAAEAETKTDGEDDYEASSSNYDYYSINKMDFSEVETGGYFQKYYERGTDEKSKSQELLKLFLSRNLSLENDQNISELRKSITYGYYEEEFSEIQEIDEEMGRKPEEIRKAFESYKGLIYAFLSDKIYYGSNLNVVVDALVQSREDIYKTEDPA